MDGVTVAFLFPSTSDFPFGGDLAEALTFDLTDLLEADLDGFLVVFEGVVLREGRDTLRLTSLYFV